MKGEGLDSAHFPPLPGKPVPPGPDLPSPSSPAPQEDLLKAILGLQQQQAENQRLFQEQLLRQSVINEHLEAQIAAAAAKPGTSDPTSSSGSAEQILERRRRLAYVPEAESNPFPRTPKTLTTRMPQLHDLHGNKTYDALAKKSNSSMKYECLVLGPALSYLHDAVVAGNSALDSAEDGNETLDSLQARLRELTNSIQGVYSLLCNRWTMLELRAQLEMDPSTSHRGGAEALRAKLQFVEDRVYQASDGVIADAVLQQWLNDFDTSKGKALLNTTAKQAAGAETGSAPRWKQRDDTKYEDKKYKDKQDDRKPSGGKGKGGRGGKPASDD
ncbi:hypothetical protein CYMTET_27844 [Cymbomonas tetramitiformis]|uniref:Uncharacterized protein n=1 Tax=Cymbomonas tetramitiformis TaxID=36881 RepID=A0AAE0FNX4_9CHLO|nr:hypothetical protein CYMTET_27844 [Cymbomonas tetramitiformis]